VGEANRCPQGERKKKKFYVTVIWGVRGKKEGRGAAGPTTFYVVGGAADFRPDKKQRYDEKKEVLLRTTEKEGSGRTRNITTIEKGRKKDGPLYGVGGGGRRNMGKPRSAIRPKSLAQ